MGTRGGAKKFGPPIVLEYLGVNKHTLKKLAENKPIRESYSDFRYFLPLPPMNNDASLKYNFFKGIFAIFHFWVKGGGFKT